MVELDKILHNFYKKNILVLEPHSDDGAYSMGGTISKLKSLGAYINCVCVFSLSHGAIGEIRKQEGRKLYEEKLGGRIIYLDYIDAYYRKKNCALLEMYKSLIVELEVVLNDIAPDYIFAPKAIGDHEDHKMLNLIVKSKFIKDYDNRVFFYEDFPYLMNNVNRIDLLKKSNVIFSNIDKFLKDKVDYYMLYKSQRELEQKEITNMYLNYGKVHLVKGETNKESADNRAVYEIFWKG